MDYVSSLPPGGPYKPGDNFNLNPTNPYYRCEPCGAEFMLTEAGNLIPLGPSEDMKRQP